MTKEAFVYCWTDNKTGMLYIGSHKGTIDDGYICSSKPMLEEYNKRPQDFTRQIISDGLFVDIRKFEEFLLNTLDVKNDPTFYNMHNGNGNFYLKNHTEEYKKRQSILLRGKKKRKCSYKKKLSDSHKQAISNSKKGKTYKPFTIKHKLNMSYSRIKFLKNNKNPLSGRIRSNETKSKISNSNSKQWIVTNPNNETIIVTNLGKYCIDNGLTFSCMIRVSKGERNHHKGYRVAKRLRSI